MKKKKLSIFLKKPAFTLAEILLTLTVIGVVAGITLPLINANANEKAWEAQKKALHVRISQALPLLPSLNSYGKLEEIQKEGKTEIEDTAAETFVYNGLSKVIKIDHICGIPKGKKKSEAANYLNECGIPAKINLADGSSISLSDLVDFNGLNDKMIGFDLSTKDGHFQYQQLNTKAAAFETANGESILVYYNPKCMPNANENILVSNNDKWYYVQPKVCANFVYDLNGIKGPNIVGKDIGVITTFYPIDPVTVAPNPYPTDQEAQIAKAKIFERCEQLSDTARVPSIEEAMSMFVNKKLFVMPTGLYWTNAEAESSGDGIFQSHTVGRIVQLKNSAHLRCLKY